MLTKELDVLAICNVLKDIVIQVTDEELEEMGFAKGIMHLVSAEEQARVLSHFENREKTVEMGGSGPNMIRTLSLLGQNVSQAGMVGKDHYGDLYLERVRSLGIVNNIRQSMMGSTGTAIILISPDGERTMITCLGMSRSYTTKDIPESDISKSKYLIVTGYQWDTDNQIEAINHAIRIARKHQTKIVFDLSDPFCVDRHRETFLNILEEYVDIVFANLKEAEMLTGKDEAGSLKDLAELCDIAVLKCGSRGSWVKSAQEEVFITSNKVSVVDTTAAGDMYAGGFMFGLLNQQPLKTCGQLATYCAETVIQHIGAHLPEDIRQQAETELNLTIKRPELVNVQS